MEQSCRNLIDWNSASSAAQQWWLELEDANQKRPDLIAALARALARRTATLDDFFLVCAYSNRKGVKENLRLLELAQQDAPAPSTHLDSRSGLLPQDSSLH